MRIDNHGVAVPGESKILNWVGIKPINGGVGGRRDSSSKVESRVRNHQPGLPSLSILSPYGLTRPFRRYAGMI